jgi:tripartite ATP-independent transporter DctM subunit
VEILLLFALLFGLLAFGVPIWVAMGGSALVTLGVAGLSDASALPANMARGIGNFELLAIPFFVLVGELMNRSGLTQRIVALLMYFLGRLRGGLAYASIGVNLFASGVSGSAPADASAVSSVMLPAMRREGYRPEYAAAVNASAAVVGPIMPPSIPMIFVALVTNLSIGALFVGGVVPAVLLAGAMLLVILWHAHEGRLPPTTSTHHSERLVRLVGAAVPALLAPVIIVAGIFLGFATITEVSMLATLYVLFLGVVVYRTIRLRELAAIFRQSTVFSSTIMILFAVVGTFTFVIAVERLGDTVQALLEELQVGPVAFVLVAMVFFLVVGMILDAVPAILIFLPIMLPVATDLGVDPIHFGVLVVINLMIGLLTPPVGALLYVLTKISGVPFGTLSRSVLPFIAAMLGVLLLLALVPDLVTWLPSLLFG